MTTPIPKGPVQDRGCPCQVSEDPQLKEGQESPSGLALSSHSGRWKGLSPSLRTHSSLFRPYEYRVPTR